MKIYTQNEQLIVIGEGQTTDCSYCSCLAPFHDSGTISGQTLHYEYTIYTEGDYPNRRTFPSPAIDFVGTTLQSCIDDANNEASTATWENVPSGGISGSYYFSASYSTYFTASVYVSRYRFRIPTEFTNENAPVKSYFKGKWQECTATNEWWSWAISQNGIEPTPSPTLIDRSWEWNGNLLIPYSDYLFLPCPDDDGAPYVDNGKTGKSNTINKLSKSYKASRIGTKPNHISGIYYRP